MKKIRSSKVLILLAVMVVLLLTAASPGPRTTSSVAAAQDLIRLTVDNKSSGPVYIRLEGEAYYYLSVGSEKEAFYTIKPGEYTQTVTACGDTVEEEEVEITRNTRMVMPECGSRAKPNLPDQGKVDLSELIKIVEITVENKSDTNMLVILEGPATYVLSLEEDDENDYTVAKGDYDVTYFACGRMDTRNFSAFKNKVLTLDCP
jgi:hypothetical protein